MDPRDKVALITGGARIGKTVAEALARRGCSLLLTYRTSRTASEETVGKARQRGVRAAAIQADLSEEEGMLAVIREAERRFGRLDVLINMASLYKRVPFDKLDLDAWKTFAADLQSAYLLSVLAAPLMRRSGASVFAWMAGGTCCDRVS